MYNFVDFRSQRCIHLEKNEKEIQLQTEYKDSVPLFKLYPTVAKEDNNLQALALSPDRNYLAVSEAGKSGTITIFQLENKKYQKIWVGTGSDFDVQELVCMAFSANSKYLLVQAGEPTWTLYYWEWEKNVIIATVKFAKSSQINQVEILNVLSE